MDRVHEALGSVKKPHLALQHQDRVLRTTVNPCPVLRVEQTVMMSEAAHRLIPMLEAMHGRWIDVLTNPCQIPHANVPPAHWD